MRSLVSSVSKRSELLLRRRGGGLLVCSPWLAPDAISSAAAMKLSPPAPTIAIVECACDEQDILFYSALPVYIHPDRQPTFRSGRRCGTGALIGAPKDANQMYQAQGAIIHLVLLLHKHPRNDGSTLDARQRRRTCSHRTASLLYDLSF